MGLSVAMAGSISIISFFSLLALYSTSSEMVYTLSSAKYEIFKIDNQIEKTEMKIRYVNTTLGDIVKFDLVNTGDEKLWNYKKFNLIVKYDADIFGTPTETVEVFDYNGTASFGATEGQDTKTLRQTIKCAGAHTAGEVQNIDLVIDCGGQALNDLTKSFVFVSFNHTSDDEHALTWRSFNLTSTTNLAINGGDATPDTVEWQAIIIEFNEFSKINVQHESYNFPTGDPDVEKLRPINPIQPKESMLIHSGHAHKTGETTIGREELDRVRIIDSTRWAYFLTGFPNSGPQDNNAQIVDWNDPGVFAQRGIATMSGLTYTVSSEPIRATSGLSDFKAIDRDTTLLFVSYAGFDNPSDFSPVTNQMMVRATLDANGDIVLIRESSTNDINFAWELIQLPEQFINVQHGVETQLSGTGNSVETIKVVGDINNSFAIGTVSTPFGNCNGSVASTGDGHIDRGQCTINLENPNQIRFIRADSTGDWNVGYQAVELLRTEVCVGGSAANDILAEEWTINCIVRDYLDPGILNPTESFEVILKLQNTIAAGGSVEITLASDNGEVATLEQNWIT